MTGPEIDVAAEIALEKLQNQNRGSRLIEKAKGILVFPSVIKGGFGFGAEYGDGVLLVKNETNTYYNMLSVSVGWQMGIQSRTVVMFFMTDEALESFRISDGFKVGVDASVAVITLDTGVEFNDKELMQPVIAIVTDRQGLMYNLSLEGTKITKVTR